MTFWPDRVLGLLRCQTGRWALLRPVAALQSMSGPMISGRRTRDPAGSAVGQCVTDGDSEFAAAVPAGHFFRVFGTTCPDAFDRELDLRIGTVRSSVSVICRLGRRANPPPQVPWEQGFRANHHSGVFDRPSPSARIGLLAFRPSC